jgi:hypothetical protein
LSLSTCWITQICISSEGETIERVIYGLEHNRHIALLTSSAELLW